MRMSLVVATKGRDGELHRLFDSLVAQSHRDFEVILVDQNSQEFLAESLALYSTMLNLRRVFSPPGLSRARNIGLQNVTGELICFPDDDCWYAPGLLANIAQEFTTNEKLIILVGKTVDAELKDSLRAYPHRSQIITKSSVWSTGNSNAIFMRSKNIVGYVWFDETLGIGAKSPFQSSEETDFLIKAFDTGCVAHYDPRIRVFHDQVALSVDRARKYAPGIGRVLRLHKFPIFLALWFIARPFLAALLATVRGQTALAKYKWLWMSGMIRGYCARSPKVRRPASPA